MKVAIIGAGGTVGSRLVNEALGRGHFVTVDVNASHSVELASVLDNHDVASHLSGRPP